MRSKIFKESDLIFWGFFYHENYLKDLFTKYFVLICIQIRVLEISDREILNDARKYFSSPVINSNETSKEITDKVISITKKSIKEAVNELVESEFYGCWDSDVSYNDMSYHYTIQDSRFSVTVSYGRLNVWVYKVIDEVWLSYII